MRRQGEEDPLVFLRLGEELVAENAGEEGGLIVVDEDHLLTAVVAA